MDYLTNIRKTIEESGLKQKFIASKMGISEQILSQMLNGTRKITADDFLQLCIVLNTDPNTLYGVA